MLRDSVFRWTVSALDSSKARLIHLVSEEPSLARLYFDGKCVPVDYAQAAHWAKLVAEQGLPHAAYNYAFVCEHGQGVPRDYAAAYLWYSRANAEGDKAAASQLKSVSHHLSRQQLDNANSQLAADASHPRQPNVAAANAEISLIEAP